MTGIQLAALIAVAVLGGAVALVPDPLRQTFLLGLYGLSLTMLFFTLQAPDVALSEIVVSTLGLPLIIFAALRKIREQDQERAEDEEDGG